MIKDSWLEELRKYPFISSKTPTIFDLYRKERHRDILAEGKDQASESQEEPLQARAKLKDWNDETEVRGYDG